MYGKVTPEEAGSKKDVRVPEEAWIIVPDAHLCIIDRDKFEALQSGKKKHNYRRTEEEKTLFKRVICRIYNYALKRVCNYQSFKAGKMDEPTYMKQTSVMEIESVGLKAQVKRLEQEYQEAVQEYHPVVPDDIERLQCLPLT